MLYDDLLKRAWKDISEPSRKRALRLAFDAGTQAAERAIADNGSEILNFLSDQRRNERWSAQPHRKVGILR